MKTTNRIANTVICCHECATRYTLRELGSPKCGANWQGRVHSKAIDFPGELIENLCDGFERAHDRMIVGKDGLKYFRRAVSRAERYLERKAAHVLR